MKSRAADGIPVDVETMRRSIDRALVLRSQPLEHAELEHLEALLRGHIEVILPDALERTDRLWRGSQQWYLNRSTLGKIANNARFGLGDEPMRNWVQVSQLARDCGWLLERHVEAAGERS
ncbi:hypothetical protein GCM10010211_81210 [Streptomyces albospinus]|uniref:Uncharacterized protein n=1 Tax=Streptomyces albospinus TaxID=285515 RepID=A0ABQ2VRU3_9ACTN|nr:DUF6415 family natural product biosynthesis protein [Streptomyces albospinus]GGV01672.1 hypothetical protein GCM10010211_81210 [Streptomyces albospinus]